MKGEAGLICVLVAPLSIPVIQYDWVKTKLMMCFHQKTAYGCFFKSCSVWLLLEVDGGLLLFCAVERVHVGRFPVSCCC
jgi:hypothetical protein